MRFAKISFLSLALLAIGFVGNAEAQDRFIVDGATLSVSAEKTLACTSATDGTLAFGKLDPAVLNEATSSALSVTCTGVVPFRVYHAAGTLEMTGTQGSKLVYTLHQAAGAGATALGTDWASGLPVTGIDGDKEYYVYGQISAAAATGAAVDTYTGSVTLIIEY